MPSRADISGLLLLPALELYICCVEASAVDGFAGELGADALDEDMPRRSSCRGLRASALCSFVEVFPMALEVNELAENIIVGRRCGPKRIPGS